MGRRRRYSRPTEATSHNSKCAYGSYGFLKLLCLILLCDGQLAPKVALHLAFDLVRTIPSAEEVVQLGERGLGGHIEAADDAGPRQRRSSRVFGEIDSPLQTLRAIDDAHSSA